MTKQYYFYEGITELQQKSKLIRLFCKHQYVDFETCSKEGFTIISGEQHIVFCKNCGEIQNKYFIRY